MNGPSFSRRAKTALVLSPDPLGAALLGAAVELAGFRVEYLRDEDAAPDVIRRTKPLAVLVDVLHPIVADPASLGPALMTGATLVFYGPASRLRDLRIRATPGALLLELPEQITELPALLHGIVTRQGRPARSE